MEQTGRCNRVLRWQTTSTRRFRREDAPSWWGATLSLITEQKLKPCLRMWNTVKEHSVVVFRLPGERGFVIQTGRRGIFPCKVPVWCRTSGEVMDFIAVTDEGWQIPASAEFEHRRRG